MTLNALKFVRYRLSVAVIYGLGIGLLSMPSLAVAGDWAASAPPETLVEHLRMELKSKDLVRQQNALMDVIVLANCRASCNVQFKSIPDRMLRIENDLGVGPAVDLSGLAPDLLRVYRSPRNDGNRFLALTALVDIGNETSLEALIENPIEDDERLHRATQRQVAAFFLTRYPELAERALANGTLSMDAIAKARSDREREARKMAREDGSGS